ncbi:1-acyl-sn-glycerol-3-phosphate acyltransferase [Pseudenhygromyxa sp. WMMC2535]|uniref:lysophospholipid acyltransferase family protein n=1 Tax=Pseudenhygromyxa sp. WMMC2535 TaxID=2712867 RepID=UPI001556A26F|nr:lysophospholipid acyltransferase family protein [Pseudenhygromyxa sp. WMMC2535]NVB40464.1 1-acyl-sn-glycerol-3-phosphate acyltransferase [Pseudenhygromyxa sp. WMMC2535]
MSEAEPQPTLRMKLFSLWFWGYLVASLTVFWFAVAIPWLVITPFDRRRRFSHWYAYTWANHLQRASLWRIQVQDGEKMRDDQAYVLVCNHQSSGDILALFSLRKQFRWVAKRVLFGVPFLGWMMAMAGYVGIKRGDPNSRHRMMRRCEEQLAMGNTVAMFPEGTRSETGEMRPFKIGAFVLACRADKPVLPVLMEGVRETLPRSSWVFTIDEMIFPVVKVLDPVEPRDFDHDAERLRDHVREVMIRERTLLRAEIDARGGLMVRPQS